MSPLFSFLHDAVDSYREIAGKYTHRERMEFVEHFFVWEPGAFHCRKKIWMPKVGVHGLIRDWCRYILSNDASPAIGASVRSMLGDLELEYVVNQIWAIVNKDFPDGPVYTEVADNIGYRY